MKCGFGRKVKNGTKHGKQNYLCKGCGHQFTTDEGAREHDQRTAVTLYCVGMSFRKIGTVLRYSHVTINNWIKQFMNKGMSENGLLKEDEFIKFLEKRPSLKSELERVLDRVMGRVFADFNLGGSLA